MLSLLNWIAIKLLSATGLALLLVSTFVVAVETYYYPGVILHNFQVEATVILIVIWLGVIVLSWLVGSWLVKLALIIASLYWLGLRLLATLEAGLIQVYDHTESLYMYYHLDLSFLESIDRLWYIVFVLGLWSIWWLDARWSGSVTVKLWLVLTRLRLWWQDLRYWYRDPQQQAVFSLIFAPWPVVLVSVLVLLALDSQVFIPLSITGFWYGLPLVYLLIGWLVALPKPSRVYSLSHIVLVGINLFLLSEPRVGRTLSLAAASSGSFLLFGLYYFLGLIRIRG